MYSKNSIPDFRFEIGPKPLSGLIKVSFETAKLLQSSFLIKLALITLLWIRIRLKRKLYVDEHLLMLTYPLFPFTTMHDPRYFKGSVY
ncbi:MAG: hypothetical protein OXC03_03690, partial [Flavobacteriaceae bacterium]|nr:hypothetical protein [Flavobacteriaceae bacterium]